MSKVDITPAAQAVKAQIEAEIAAGGDPFGDDEPLVAETIEDQANKAAAKLVDEQGEDDPASIDEPTGEAVEKTAEKAADEAPEAKPDAEQPKPAQEAKAPEALTFTVDSADFKAQQNELRATKRDLANKWTAGELTDAEYVTQTDEVDGKLLDLTVQMTRATTLHEINVQSAARVQAATRDAENAAMSALAMQSKAAGLIDYAMDQAAAAQFDALFAATKLDPANAGKSASELVEKAHTAVLTLRGIAPAAKPTPAAERVTPAAPLTLRGLPNAATSNSGGTVADSIGRLTGDAYRAAWSKLTPAQKAAMLDD